MPNTMNLKDLIAAPIRAINEAEAQNAMTFVELLSQHAFKDGASPDEKTLQTLNFSTRRMNAAGEVEERNIELPLLQLLPFGGVSIDNVQLDYDLHVSIDPAQNADQVSNLTAQIAQYVAGGNARGGSVDGNMSIKMELKRSDFPQGVLDLLQQTAGGIDTLKPTGRSVGAMIQIPASGRTVGWIEYSPKQLLPVEFSAGSKVAVDLSVTVSDQIKYSEQPLAKISVWPHSAFTLVQPKEANVPLVPGKENPLRMVLLANKDFGGYAKSTLDRLSISIDVSARDQADEALSSKFRIPLRLRG